jgi:hypothetical protein
MIIRKETENDHRAVEELTREAFWNLYVPGCTEHYVLHTRKSRILFGTGLRAEIRTDCREYCLQPRDIRDRARCGPGSLCLGQSASCLFPNKVRRLNYSQLVWQGYDYPAFLSEDQIQPFRFRCAEKYDIKTADGKFAIALLALELKPGGLNNMPGRFIESPAFEADPDKFTEYEAKFPYKEKLETESQREFKLLASLRY